MEVWVLYEESGAYSDYGMSIEGVFSTPELAMAYVAAECEAAVKSHPSNARYARRTAWVFSEEDHRYHCKIEARYSDAPEWTIKPYAVDAPYEERPPL